MKTKYAAVITVLASLAFTSMAQAGPGERREERREDAKAKMLERFDVDGDGELSSEERALAGKELKKFGKKKKAHLKQHMKRLKEQFDVDGDGVLSESEKEAFKAAREERKAKILEEFDADGDGTLSKEERKAAREAYREKHKEIEETEGNEI